jgi:hypothetical protein
MLLIALCCTVATICIKIAHVVKVLRVEVAQLSTVTQRKNHRHDVTQLQSPKQQTQQREFAQVARLHCKGAGWIDL